MSIFRRSVATTAVTAALVSSLLIPTASHAAVGDLYAATGGGGGAGFCTGGTLSSLYTLDPATAAATLVGPIEINDVQIRHVSALAVHPSTGVLYGVMNGQVLNVDCTESTLLTIDPTTGAATIVGSQGSILGPIPDITFDPFGTLYAWSEDGDELYTIDITDGSYSQVDFSSITTFQTGLASDSDGRLFLKVAGSLMQINPFTAAQISSISMDRGAHDMLAFDANDVLYSIERSSLGFELFTIDPETGTTTLKGSNDIVNVSALTFDRGVVTPPDASDLSLDKDVDEPIVLIGTDVVFTLTLTNDGPDAANNVVVSDVLPSQFAFVSSSGDGSYDDTTGEWTLASISASATASIEITATATSDGEYLNTAEVIASDSYDTDSIPGSGDTSGDTYTEVSGEVVLPTLFSIDRSDDLLWVIDPEFNVVDVAQELSLPGHSICGGNGLATQPGTETLFGVLEIDDCNSRTLVTIDPATADVTEIGNFGSTRIAAIAFGADAGTLYATSGNNGSPTRTLFTVDPADASLTPRCVLETSNYGRALVYHDGRLYDATYDCSNFCQLVIRVIDPGDFPGDASETCPGTTIETGLQREPTGMTLLESGPGSVTMLLASFGDVYEVTIPGASSPADWSLAGFLSHSSKGLAFAAASVTTGNLTTSKSASKSRVKGDKFIEYLLQANNTGPDAIDNVVLTDAIPFGTTLVSAGGCSEAGGVMTCDAGTLDAGTSEFFSFVVQVTCKKCSSITNYVSISTESENVYDNPYDNQSQISTGVKGKF